jgi:hypothetical protein
VFGPNSPKGVCFFCAIELDRRKATEKL